MIGTHFILDIKEIKNHKNDTLIKENWHYKKTVYENKQAIIEYSSYNGYPIEIWNEGDYIIVFEGMIYDRNSDDIKSSIKNIIATNDKNSEKLQIKKFIEDSDGDYIVLIFNKKNNKIIAFNNMLATVPLFYFIDNEKIIIARNISYILENIPFVKFTKEALLEYIALEYNIGKNTLFDNIYKLVPAQAIIGEIVEDKMKVEISKIVEDDFSLKKKFKNKKESIEYLKSVLFESVENRVHATKDREVFNEMSGGFDSRTILAVMSKITKNFTNICYEYIQDESLIAKQLSDISSIKLKKNSFDLNSNIDNRDQVFKINALNNCFITSACLNEEIYNRNNLSDNAVIFGGIGGEYIRHPFFRTIGSPLSLLLYKQSKIPYKKFIKIVSGDKIDLKSFLNETINYKREKNKEAVIKRLYNQYYINFVNMAAVDRSRLSFWRIHPLMSHKFILTVRDKIPLRWVSFRYFLDFIKSIEPKFLDVPIYNSNKDLHSKFSFFVKDMHIKLEYLLFNVIAKLNTKRFKNRNKFHKVSLETIENAYSKLKNKDLFNIEAIRHDFPIYSGLIKLRLLTLMHYIFEIEKRFEVRK